MQLQPKIILLMLFFTETIGAPFPLFQPKSKPFYNDPMWTPTGGGTPTDFICEYSSYVMNRFTVYFDDSLFTNLLGFEVQMIPFNTDSNEWAPCIGLYGTKTIYL